MEAQFEGLAQIEEDKLQAANETDIFSFLRKYVKKLPPAKHGAPYKGSGKYDVKITKEDSLFIYTPVSNSENGPAVWPGIVFGHGLCGMVEFYENFLTDLSTWGYVVIATTVMSNCISNPFENGFGANTANYVTELVSNVKYMSEMENVNASQIALVGHSMGGGGAISAAAELSQTNPGLVKAVVGISPWNGVDPLPSSVVSEIKSPILLFCGAKDGLTPCSGLVNILFGFKPNTVKLIDVLPSFFGAGSRDWNGGVSAIFGNISDTTPAILADMKYANHFFTADTDGEMSQALQDWVAARGAQFNDVKMPPNYILPTAEYTLAFLDWAFTNNSAAYEMIWGKGILSDNRFVKVKRKNIPS